MKTILIISRSFYPLNSPRSFRTTELAKEFARQGHKVTVLTPLMKEHSKFQKEHNLTIEDLGQPKWGQIKLNGKGLSLLFKRAIRRFSQLLFEYPNIEYYFKVKKALKKKRKAKEHYDMLISIAVPYPVHWGVASVWKKKNNIANTWVADCGDPFMGRENDTFKVPFYFKYVEKWFCKKVNYLTVPVETAIPAYYPEFHHKIKVIPQGFNFEDIDVAEKVNTPFPSFAYAGGLIPGKRDPKAFLEFLVNYPKQYRFTIYTKQVDMVLSYAKRSKGRIIIKDYLPRKELLFELSKLDFVVNFENAGEKQIPSKLIDYAIIQKPILGVNSFNFNQKVVEEFLNGSYTKAIVIKNREDYRIENVVQNFINLSRD